MSSTYNDVRAAIEGRIATEMALAPSYPVAYPNVPFTPPNNEPWIQVSLTFGDNSYATLIGPSTGFNKQNGLLTVNTFTPVGVGAAANYTIAERIKDLFDRQTISSIIFDAAAGPNVITPSEPEAAYLQTQLVITFEAYLD
jgi:hypothetical protein